MAEQQVQTQTLKPAPAVAETPGLGKSALASDKSMLGGKMDNNGALMGVSGAKYIESKPPEQLDEKGLPLKFDANGHPVLKQSVVPSGGQGPTGPGDSYKEMSQKLESERKALAFEQQKRDALAMKEQIVQQIRGGNNATYLHDQLAQLNRDIFNLPANHTGY